MRWSTCANSVSWARPKKRSAAVVPWVLLAPVVAMAAAWLLLAQRPNAGETLGGAVLLLGVLVALRPTRDRPAGGVPHDLCPALAEPPAV